MVKDGDVVVDIMSKDGGFVSRCGTVFGVILVFPDEKGVGP